MSVKKVFLFSLPWLLYYVLILICDPYNYYGTQIINNDVKSSISKPIDQVLWSLIEYKNNPNTRILVGDSRAGTFTVASFSVEGGVKPFIFSGGAATLVDMKHWIEFARKYSSLKEITLCVHFCHYNAVNNRDITMETNRILKPYYFFIHPFNRSVVLSASQIVIGLIRGNEEEISSNKVFANESAPSMTREEFWKYQLGFPTRKRYENYIEPKQMHSDLVDIIEKCRQEGVSVRFIVPPTHQSAQDAMNKFGWIKERDEFPHQLATMGPVWDFDIPSPLTADSTNFGDPFHFYGNWADSILVDMKREVPKYCLYYPWNQSGRR